MPCEQVKVSAGLEIVGSDQVRRAHLAEKLGFGIGVSIQDGTYHVRFHLLVANESDLAVVVDQACQTYAASTSPAMLKVKVVRS